MADRDHSDVSESESSDGGFVQRKKEALPDAVDHFLGLLLQALQSRNVAEVHKLYEDTFNKLTDRYYKNTRWPSVDAVEEQVSNDKLFIILYKELFYRHVYSRCAVTFQDRKESWENYCLLLDLLTDELEAEEEPSANLPAQWIWDILDEFVYHFQTCCAYRNKAAKMQKESEMELVRNNPEVFDTTQVLRFLHGLIKYSRIEGFLQKPDDGTKVGAYTSEVVRNIGYFSIMQLLRMHVLLGDYHLAMRTIACVDYQSEVPLFYKIPACHITLYYYMGFSYLMLRRYVDAIRSFSDILVFLSKTSGVNSLSYQYDQMMKKQDQMYALLLMALALCPQPVDESLDRQIREKYAEKQARLQRGEELVFEELFSYACPKFISAAPPDFSRLESFNPNEAHHRQLHLFLAEVKQQQSLPTIGSYMKLYTAIKMSKLAQLCETDEEGLRDQLLCVMHKTRQLVRPEGQPPLDGGLQPCSEVEFYIDGSMVHINATKPQRPHTEVFLEHITKFQDILRKLGNSGGA